MTLYKIINQNLNASDGRDWEIISESGPGILLFFCIRGKNIKNEESGPRGKRGDSEVWSVSLGVRIGQRGLGGVIIVESERHRSTAI